MIPKLKIYKDVPTKQSTDILKTFPQLMQGKFKRILEIGTYCGGLSLLVTELAPDAEYLGYEIDGSVVHQNVSHLNIKTVDFIADLDYIEEYIQREGRCLVLCDGGNKQMEFTVLSPLIKVNDVIMTHDYLDNTVHPESVYRSVEGFRKPETTKTMLQSVANRYNLSDECDIDFTYSLWSYWRKIS